MQPSVIIWAEQSNSHIVSLGACGEIRKAGTLNVTSRSRLGEPLHFAIVNDSSTVISDDEMGEWRDFE